MRGRLTHFPGGYQYYLDKSAAVSAQAGLTAGNNAAAPAPAPVIRGPKPKNKSAKKPKNGRRATVNGRREEAAVAKLEAEILRLETRQKELATELESPATYEKPGHAMVLNRELMEVAEHLKSLGKQWEEAADKLGDTAPTADRGT